VSARPRSHTLLKNYPFCTIEPNEARVPVPDERYEWLADHFNPPSRVPAALQITDIAGLIRGASQGEGLGNAFLSHIRAVDGVYQVVRIFEDADVTHVEESVDPVRDMEIIRDELILKDIEYCEGAIERAQGKQKHKPDKDAAKEEEVLRKVMTLLKENKQIRFAEWHAWEIEILNEHQFLTAKTMVYLVNMTERDFIRKRNKWLPKIKVWVDENAAGSPIVPYCGQLEWDLMTIHEDAAAVKAMQEEKGFVSQIDKIITTGYRALDLIHFFTTGTDEVKCWTLRDGTKAPGAGGVIHTDFEKAFICAEVQRYEDYRELGSETAVKAAGKYQQKGKDYVVQDGDMILFKVGQVQAGKDTKSAKKK
jgi:obg-like ATPase 1